MSKKANLTKAKNAKKDEFYTRLEDIEKELKHYKEQFKGKVIMLPCDDIELLNGIDLNGDGVIQPEERMSQFWVYFHKNFNALGLKKLIATAYSEDKIMHKVVYEGGDGKSNGSDNDVMEFIKTPLTTNGDFRSPEVKELMQGADIIVTNPPFSLFREFIAQLEEMGKKFLILGHQNAITYKETFKLIKENKLRLGNTGGNMQFYAPHYENYSKAKADEGCIVVSGIKWFTNLVVSKRNEEIIPVVKYNEVDFPKYDNYDAINVDKVVNIPKEYYGAMGVPITFLDKHNPAQFEIIGLGIVGSCEFSCNKKMEILKNGEGTGKFTRNAKGTLYVKYNPNVDKKPAFKDIETGELYASRYARILIKRIKGEK